MTRRKLGLSLVLVLAVASLFMIGSSVEAKGRCICPQVYAPVECAHGRVFSNQCVADCRNAKDCVPLEIFEMSASDSDGTLGTCDLELETAPTLTADAPVSSMDDVSVETECTSDSNSMGPSCDKQCEKDRKRCVRQGNDETDCYNNVFCSCMCDTCNDCIC